ncbi:hypothetical protein DYH09_28715 [bacterium CPR1]|nr:hypothetical protein [bacterium CPR1]
MGKRLLCSALVGWAGFHGWYLVWGVLILGVAKVPHTDLSPAACTFYERGNLIVFGMVLWSLLHPERTGAILKAIFLTLLLVMIPLALAITR